MSILEVQQLLNKLTNAGLDEDGSSGPKTVLAIKSYQMNNNLLPDGKISSDLISSLRAKSGVLDAIDNSPSLFEHVKDFLGNNTKASVITASAFILFGGIWFLKDSIKKQFKMTK